MLISDITLVYLFVWKGEQDGLIVLACSIVALWFGILGFLGLGRCGFNQTNAFTKYMSSSSFMIYIFHFVWLIVIQYYLSYTTFNVAVSYMISITTTLILTLLTCEFVKRIPGIRILFDGKGRTTGLKKII